MSLFRITARDKNEVFKSDNTTSITFSNTSRKTEKRHRRKVTFAGVWPPALVALTGLWQYGFSVGSVNSAYVPITDAIRQHYEVRWQSNVTFAQVQAVYVTATAMFPAGGLIGSFLVQPIAAKIGRLRGLLFGHIVIIFCSILVGLTDVLRAPELFVLSRFGFGLTAGAIGYGVSTMYMTEVSPRHLRGVFGTLTSVMLSFGAIVANVLGLPQILGNAGSWPVLLAFTGLPSLFLVVLFPTLPDSPRELYIEKEKTDKAEKILRKLNRTNDVDDILEELAAEKKLHSQTRLTVKQVMCSSRIRKPLLAAAVMAVALELAGIDAITMNYNNILQIAGIEEDKAPYVTIGLICSSMTTQLFVTYLIEKFGRKILLMLGYTFQSFFLIISAVCMETQENNKIMAYVAIVSSFGFHISFGLGSGPVTFTILPELFDQASRPGGMTVSIALYWISFTVVSISTPYMLGSIAGYTYVVFAVMTIISVIYIRFRVPETKNRQFAEIQQQFQEGIGKANKRYVVHPGEVIALDTKVIKDMN